MHRLRRVRRLAKTTRSARSTSPPAPVALGSARRAGASDRDSNRGRSRRGAWDDRRRARASARVRARFSAVSRLPPACWKSSSVPSKMPQRRARSYAGSETSFATSGRREASLTRCRGVGGRRVDQVASPSGASRAQRQLAVANGERPRAVDCRHRTGELRRRRRRHRHHLHGVAPADEKAGELRPVRGGASDVRTPDSGEDNDAHQKAELGVRYRPEAHDHPRSIGAAWHPRAKPQWRSAVDLPLIVLATATVLSLIRSIDQPSFTVDVAGGEITFVLADAALAVLAGFRVHRLLGSGSLPRPARALTIAAAAFSAWLFLSSAANGATAMIAAAKLLEYGVLRAGLRPVRPPAAAAVAARRRARRLHRCRGGIRAARVLRRAVRGVALPRPPSAFVPG